MSEAPKDWVIFAKRHQLYYGPDRCGYTGVLDHAGRYTEEYAKNYCAFDDDLNCLHESEAAEFAPACYEDVKWKHLAQKRAALEAENARLRDGLETCRVAANLTPRHPACETIIETVDAALSWEAE